MKAYRWSYNDGFYVGGFMLMNLS